VINKAARKSPPIDSGNETLDEKSEESPELLKDEDLVARVRENDQWATEALIRRYQKKAYAIAFQMCSGDCEEAKDLTQEAFLKTFKNIQKFKGESLFYTWFYRIVVNTCLDGRRRRHKRERIFSSFLRSARRGKDGEKIENILEEQPDMSENSNPLAVLHGRQLAREIQKAMGSLPKTQRMAFQLKVLHGMSISEIAQIMKLAQGTVKSHLFRASHFLKEALNDWIVS
jgi:RNA polymerase sigma-70 factor (ECF subfamily)